MDQKEQKQEQNETKAAQLDDYVLLQLCDESFAIITIMKQCTNQQQAVQKLVASYDNFKNHFPFLGVGDYYGLDPTLFKPDYNFSEHEQHWPEMAKVIYQAMHDLYFDRPWMLLDKFRNHSFDGVSLFLMKLDDPTFQTIYRRPPGVSPSYLGRTIEHCLRIGI